jgi:hypothetical protein
VGVTEDETMWTKIPRALEHFVSQLAPVRTDEEFDGDYTFEVTRADISRAQTDSIRAIPVSLPGGDISIHQANAIVAASGLVRYVVAGQRRYKESSTSVAYGSAYGADMCAYTMSGGWGGLKDARLFCSAAEAHDISADRIIRLG